MIIKSQLATLLTSVGLGKTPQIIRRPRASSGDPGLAIAQTHMDTKPRSWEVVLVGGVRSDSERDH